MFSVRESSSLSCSSWARLYCSQQCGLRPLISIILLLLHTSQYFSISVIFQIYAAMPQHTPLWKTNKFSSGIDMNSSETKINLQLSGSQKQHHKLIKLLKISIYVFAGFERKEPIKRVFLDDLINPVLSVLFLTSLWSSSEMKIKNGFIACSEWSQTENLN